MPQSRSEEHTSFLQSLTNLVCRLLLEKKITKMNILHTDDPYTKPIGATHLLPRRRRHRQVHANHAAGRPPSETCSFFFNDTGTPEIYTLSLHDALPIPHQRRRRYRAARAASPALAQLSGRPGTH